MNTGDYIMARQSPSEPITIRTAKVAEIDALAAAMDRSRNYIVNQAIEQYLEANAWQIERIKKGIAAARDGRTVPADDVFAGIAAKHGWSR
jgi:predicted transcriptional regulator